MSQDGNENTVKRAVPGILPDRAQPHDLSVERAVLGAMLREPKPCVDIAVQHFSGASGGNGGETVFYSPVHREVYKAMVELYERDRNNLDMVSVAHYLRSRERLDSVGGEIFLAELYGCIATTVNLDTWCGILNQYATLRRMIDVCGNSLLKCYDSDADAARLVGEIEDDIFSVRSSRDQRSIVKIQDAIFSEFKALQDILAGNSEVGISTGFSRVDMLTGGLKKGEMFVLAARPSIGKTSLALNVIRNMIIGVPHPRRVALFSLEMASGQIARRMFCTQAKVSESMFWSRSLPVEMGKLTGIAQSFSEADFVIDDTSRISIVELRAKARRLNMIKPLDCIVIDYLQLMRADARIESRQQEVAEISGGIKALAKDLKVPVLVLAQLNRELDKNTGANARPKLAHLRESGAIEQDADIVSFLHRDRDLSKEEKGLEETDAEWIIEKNRNGSTGVAKLKFYPRRMEFSMAPPQESDPSIPRKGSGKQPGSGAGDKK